MKKLSDSFIFNELINSNRLKNTIKNINISRDIITVDRLDSYNLISKKLNFPLKSKVITNVDRGLIKIIRNETNALPRYLNTLVIKGSDNKPMGITDITNFSTLDRGKVGETPSVSIMPKLLYTFLLNNTINLEIMLRYNEFIHNTSLIQYSSIVYTKFICKVLDKMMGINIDSDRSDLTYFLVSKFFLTNMIEGLTPSMINTMAYMSVFNNSKLEYLIDMEEDMKNKYSLKEKEDPYTNINTFFKLLRENSYMDKLTFRTFMEQYLRMFGEPAMLAMDYFPALIGMVFGSEIGGGFYKDYIVENVAGKTSKKVISEFTKLF